MDTKSNTRPNKPLTLYYFKFNPNPKGKLTLKLNLIKKINLKLD